MKTFFSVCTLSGWHAWEGDNDCTHEFELTHGNKNLGTSFTRTCLGQQMDHITCRKVVLPHDPRSSYPQSLVGPGTGLEPGIGHCLDATNFAQE